MSWESDFQYEMPAKKSCEPEYRVRGRVAVTLLLDVAASSLEAFHASVKEAAEDLDIGFVAVGDGGMRKVSTVRGNRKTKVVSLVDGTAPLARRGTDIGAQARTVTINAKKG